VIAEIFAVAARAENKQVLRRADREKRRDARIVRIEEEGD